MAIENEEAEFAAAGAPVLLRPADAGEAWRLKRQFGVRAAYVSGGTLLRTHWEHGTLAMPAALIDIRGLPGLSGVTVDASGVTIGAMTTLAECRRQPLLAARAPALQEAIRLIAAPSVRNLGTIGGNVVCGVGDALPALLACDAELIWQGAGGIERQPVRDWLERRGVAAEERLLAAIRLPEAGETGKAGGAGGAGAYEAYRKVGRREAFTASVATIALRGRLAADGTWTDCRIAAAGGAAVPQRLYTAEALWNGRSGAAFDPAAVRDAVALEFRAANDAFASEAYRRATAGNLVAAELWGLMQRS
ncbi:FAD binding domain-containing protein [Paenibacillus sp. TRM 82003]|nr:FAD binding domain-containing protein [Paenibacillus sp. TRM 82003]